MSQGLWSPPEILARLGENPSLLEPGLVLHPGPAELGDGPLPSFHGVDPMQRPCLVLFEERFEPEFFDRLLEVAAHLDQPPVHAGTPYEPQGTGRVFVLAPMLEVQQLERFEVLGRAVSLRAFTLGLHREAGRVQPTLAQEYPVQSADLELGLDGLLPHVTEAARRVLKAARVIRPALEVRGPEWPLVIAGRHGPCATLHRSEEGDRLVFATQSGVLDLEDDAAVDRAVDRLLREQWAGQPVA